MIDKILVTWALLLLPISVYGLLEIHKDWPTRRWTICSTWAVALFPLLLIKIWF